MTLFLVPGNAEGVTIRQIPKLGMRCVGSCEVFLDDVFVPDDLVLGEPGPGLVHAAAHAQQRAHHAVRVLLGILDGVLEDAVEYLGERNGVRASIGQFQALQHYVADIAMWRLQAELMTYQRRLAAEPRRAVRHRVQHGEGRRVGVRGQGRRPRHPGPRRHGLLGRDQHAQRYWRDARLFRIGPITNEMARNTIAESLGLPRSF